MRHSKPLAKALFALALCGGIAAAVAGCNSNQAKSNEMAAVRWKATRAAVLGNLAKEHYENGIFDKARDTVKEALALHPGSAFLHVLSAKISIEEGRLESAEKSLAEARRLAPKSAEPDYLSGVVCQRWQKLEEAAEYYRAATEKQPQELAYLLAQAEIYVALNRSEEALALLQSKVVYFEHSPVIRDAVGQLFMQKGDYAHAVDLFRQASNLATDDMSIRERLAMAYMRCNRYTEAVDTLTRVIRDEKFANRGDLWVALGQAQMQLGRTRDAKNSFETATQHAEKDPAAWLALGKAALELNDLKRAELSLRRSVALDAGNGEAHLLTGYVRIKQDNLDDALASFQKASALDPDDSVSVCMIGYVLEKKGKGKEAMEQYAKALKIKPGDELATRLMAEVKLNQ